MADADPSASRGATTPRGSSDPGTAVQRLVASIKDLPPMPHMASRLLQLLADPGCSTSAVTEVISHDPALVARLVKVANSSLYGGANKAGSLNQAVVRLGMRATRNLVVAFSTRSLFPLDNSRVGLWAKELWRHSVECGVAARQLAEAAGGADPDEAFVGGLLHDLGKIVILLNQAAAFRQIQQLQEAEQLEARAAETRVLGFDHAQVGARLLQHWEMPATLVSAVAGHHDSTADARLDRIVACGNVLCHGAQVPVMAGEAESVRSIPDGARPHAEALGLDENALAGVSEAIAADLATFDMLD
jgi:putative nucleotidyltransferase with HDIG domain